MPRSLRARRVAIALSTALAASVVTLPAWPASATTIALWHMDETSGGVMNDASGSENDGVLEDVVFASPGSDGTGGAYAFNGTSSRVLIDDAPSLNPGSANFTMTAHVRFTVVPTGSAGDYDLIRKKGQGRMYRMEIWNTGQAFCTFKGSTAAKSVRKGPNLADGRWHTITCAKTSNVITLTVDGVSWSKTITIGSIANTTDLVLGGKIDATDDWYLGEMDEVSITIS